MGTGRILSTLLILFGAGVEAPGCASACSDPVSTGRWIVGLSLVIFILPFAAAPPVRRFLRRLVTPVTRRKPRSRPRRSIRSRLTG
ncbi:hypothetical protein [Sphingopyxis soli]|uniref:hypothetical protein n=1 Tax=Sphingopyxis soli TaxID=592051 RepID=UPI0031D959A5